MHSQRRYYGPKARPRLSPPGLMTPGHDRLPARRRPSAFGPQPARALHSTSAQQARPKPRRWLWVVAPLALLPVFVVVTVALVALGMLVLLGGRIYPGVSTGGVALGGLNEAEARAVLATEWGAILLRDGDRSLVVQAADLGITLDEAATAGRAYAQGREQGPWLSGVGGAVSIPPVIQVDDRRARGALEELAQAFAVPPENAGLRLENGQVVTVPPQNGRALDVEATLLRLQDATELADGVVEVVTRPVAPAITDVSALVEAAQAVLSQPLTIRVFDPVTGDSVDWTLPPEQWGSWLQAAIDPAQPTGLNLHLDEDALRQFIDSQAASVFDPVRYLKTDEVVESVQTALAAGSPRGYARVYHHDRQHVVQPGESLISIAWDYGVPYPWIQQANGGIQGVSAGQTIIIPSPDNFFEYPVVPNKRIVVSISQQHVWVYENGDLKWEWVASTGIPDSPTWPGVYQIISHVPNAYASNWNLYMPNFMGVYRPIPGADFVNGFHGFPTRGGSQLLWTNSLGRRVTYGCILLSDTNARQLYEWAEEGVVVEIRA
ncbi:MAG: hypothetical protein Kow0077_05540 [Anaerolineae bacterium]